MNLALAFLMSARKQADKPALFYGERLFSYGEIRSRSTSLAILLRDQHGIRPGDRVGIWLKNCPEYLIAFFAILQAGAVIVPINNFLKPEEVLHMLRDANINLLISESGMASQLEILREVRPETRSLVIEDFPESAPPADFAPPARTEEDLALIIYTSGTTGRPKGAMLSHGNLLQNVESCRQVLEVVSYDRFVLLLPMFHSFMICVCILLPILVGGSIVLIKSVHPPKNIFHEIQAHQATILPAIPPLFRALANTPIPDQLALRLCVSGAAPLPAEILKEFNQKFPIPLLEGYGLSEASPVVSMNPIRGPWKTGSVGIPVPGVEVSVQNDEGVHLSHGNVGEICVRGGNVMLGYWRNPAETAAAKRGDWLLTGDIGYADRDGYYYITDRKKDMLLVNGINVYPREVEEIIYQFPGVKEAAVIGLPDSRRGEQPVAFVSAAEGAILDEKALLQFVRGKLADYKVPRKVHFLPALPRNATGKILKTVLRTYPLAAGQTS